MLRKAMCSVAFYRRWLVCLVVFFVLCLAYSWLKALFCKNNDNIWLNGQMYS